MVIGLGSSILSSCGSGVDQSNPRSVAEKALECYHSGNYVQLKTLVDPSDAEFLKQIDDLIELSDEYRAKHPDKEPEPVEFTYKSMSDDLRGGDVTDATTTACVQFDSEKWPRRVVVVKVNGKWYLEKIK